MSTKRDLILVGIGDASRLAASLFAEEGRYRVVGFAVDDAFFTIDKFENLPVFRFTDFLKKFPASSCDVFVGIGYTQMNKARETKSVELKGLGYQLATYVSPHAVCLTKDIGQGSFLFEGVIVQPFVSIGEGVILWSGTTIAHDTTVGDYSFFGPRAAVSGHVKIGKRCVIGLNATIKDHVSVADETLVAAGALVVKDTSTRSLWKSAAAILSTKKSTDVKKI